MNQTRSIDASAYVLYLPDEILIYTAYNSYSRIVVMMLRTKHSLISYAIETFNIVLGELTYLI